MPKRLIDIREFCTSLASKGISLIMKRRPDHDGYGYDVAILSGGTSQQVVLELRFGADPDDPQGLAWYHSMVVSGTLKDVLQTYDIKV